MNTSQRSRYDTLAAQMVDHQKYLYSIGRDGTEVKTTFILNTEDWRMLREVARWDTVSGSYQSLPLYIDVNKGDVVSDYGATQVTHSPDVLRGLVDIRHRSGRCPTCQQSLKGGRS